MTARDGVPDKDGSESIYDHRSVAETLLGK